MRAVNNKFSVTRLGVTQNYTLGLADVNKTLEIEITKSCRHLDILLVRRFALQNRREMNFG